MVSLIFPEIYTVHVRACEQGVANGPWPLHLRPGLGGGYLRVCTIREKGEAQRISGGIGSISIFTEPKVITRRDSLALSLLVQSYLSIRNAGNNVIRVRI